MIYETESCHNEGRTSGARTEYVWRLCEKKELMVGPLLSADRNSSVVKQSRRNALNVRKGNFEMLFCFGPMWRESLWPRENILWRVPMKSMLKIFRRVIAFNSLARSAHKKELPSLHHAKQRWTSYFRLLLYSLKSCVRRIDSLVCLTQLFEAQFGNLN